MRWKATLPLKKIFVRPQTMLSRDRVAWSVVNISPLMARLLMTYSRKEQVPPCDLLLPSIFCLCSCFLPNCALSSLLSPSLYLTSSSCAPPDDVSSPLAAWCVRAATCLPLSLYLSFAPGREPVSNGMCPVLNGKAFESHVLVGGGWLDGQMFLVFIW